MHPLFSSDIPEIRHGQPPPGHARWRGTSLAWSGPPAWKVVHAGGTSLWIGGLMVAALGEDGAHYVPGMPDTDSWRCSGADGTWTHGSLTANARLAFSPDASQPVHPSWSPGSLPAAILASEAARGFAREGGGAGDLYGALCSSAGVHPSSGREYAGDWYRAAFLAAQARGRGDAPQDYLLYGNEGDVDGEAAEVLGLLGWVHAGPVPEAGDGLPRAMRVLETAEARPAMPAPAWYARWATALLASPGGPAGRMHAAAFSGRASFREWCAFWEFLPLDDG